MKVGRKKDKSMKNKQYRQKSKLPGHNSINKYIKLELYLQYTYILLDWLKAEEQKTYLADTNQKLKGNSAKRINDLINSLFSPFYLQIQGNLKIIVTNFHPGINKSSNINSFVND